MKKCNGCISIRKELFPFGFSDNRYYIDQEGCGINGNDSLTIRFCPVCGKFLYEIIERQNDRERNFKESDRKSC